MIRSEYEYSGGLRVGDENGFQFITKVLDWVEVWALCRSCLQHQSLKTVSLRTSLCALGYCHVEKGFPHNI